MKWHIEIIMSIQETIARQRGKPGIGLRLINRFSEASQKTFRFLDSDSLKVFYPYRNLLHTHPFFMRYYNYPPLNYSNLCNANLCHWVSHIPKNLEHLPFILEPQDHPLSVTAQLEPIDAISRIKKAIDVYMSSNCKKILVESEGQLSLFKRYFPESVIAKTEIVRLGSLAQSINLKKIINPSHELVYLCLASDFERKAVDLLIQAWRDSSAKLKCKLILACPNVPQEMWDSLKKENVQLIAKAPLTEREKYELHSIAHVVIAPLHVDGGANIIEAFEFGLPVITMRSQRSFIRGGNGWEVDVPFYFYDEGYGKEWPTFARFWELVDDAKKNHAFDITIQGFVNIFDQISKSPEKLFVMGNASYELAKGEFSLENRNATLRKIYREALK
jgi:glycosyltransferase involved in cell wall biosynthesis